MLHANDKSMIVLSHQLRVMPQKKINSSTWSITQFTPTRPSCIQFQSIFAQLYCKRSNTGGEKAWEQGYCIQHILVPRVIIKKENMLVYPVLFQNKSFSYNQVQIVALLHVVITKSQLQKHFQSHHLLWGFNISLVLVFN